MGIEHLEYLFGLMDKSISFSDVEIIQLKAYVMLKPDKMDAITTVFEKEQEKIKEIDTEFEENIQKALDEKNLSEHQEKINQATSMGEAVQSTIEKIKQEELETEEDADEFLNDMLESM